MQFRASAPHTTPETSTGGSRPPCPGHGPWAPHRTHNHSTTRTPERERAKGKPAATKRGKAQGDRQTLTGLGLRGQQITGARNHQGASNTERGKGQGPQHWGQRMPRGQAPGHTPTEGGDATPGGPTPPHPPAPGQHRPAHHRELTARPPRDTATPGHSPQRQTNPEAHVHQAASPQPRSDNAQATQGHAYQPSAPTWGKGCTPSQGTTESTAQATNAP